MRDVPPTPLASLLFGACCEATLVIADAPDPQAAIAEMTVGLEALLGGLRC